MLVKFGVDISRLERNTRRSLRTVESIHLEYEIEAVITSTYEGNHGVGSLHYANQAYDLRRSPTQSDHTVIVDILKSRLGINFDIVDESNHIHIEYDPKNV